MRKTNLTNRETKILELIKQGKTNKEIGGELNLAEQTIKNEITRILRKLNAKNRVQALMMAIRDGYIK